MRLYRLLSSIPNDTESYLSAFSSMSNFVQLSGVEDHINIAQLITTLEEGWDKLRDDFENAANELANINYSDPDYTHFTGIISEEHLISTIQKLSEMVVLGDQELIHLEVLKHYPLRWAQDKSVFIDTVLENRDSLEKLFRSISCYLETLDNFSKLGIDSLVNPKRSIPLTPQEAMIAHNSWEAKSTLIRMNYNLTQFVHPWVLDPRSSTARDNKFFLRWFS